MENNLDRELDELEKSISEAEATVVKTGNMAGDDKKFKLNLNGNMYMYIIGAITPLIVAGALYFIQPGWVKKKEKGKMVISWPTILKYTALVTVLVWVGFIFTDLLWIFQSIICF